MGLSNEKIYLAKVIAAKTSGSISMIGSGFIIRDVMLRWQRRKEHQFLPIVHRIILSMSIADLFTSCFVHILGTWMVPKGNVTMLDESFLIPLAAGNETTCNAQAFIWDLFTLAGCCSNAMLAVTYWLVVCRKKSEKQLNKWKWQFPLLWLPWLLGLAYSFIFVVGFGFYSLNGAWFCGAYVSDDIPWRNWMLAAIAGIINVWIILMMVLLIKFVCTLERKTDTYRRNRETREKSIQVTKQGIWFILAYMAALMPAVVTIISEDLPRNFPIFVACAYPMQGAFNALSYFRPKYISERQKMASRSDRRESRVSSILKTLSITPPKRSSASSNAILQKVPAPPNEQDDGCSGKS
mmetsp:Transcript_26708/g.55055  ORF Transcript_26708/g.55055 Transcript_26708/m.55055 type:complete len:352 (-) Transcript_26708:477-1532(-)